MVKEVILERLTRKPRKKRSSIAQLKLLEWVECMDPEMVLSDIPLHSRPKIEDLEELENYIERRQLQLEGKVRPQDKIKDPYMTGDFARVNTHDGSDDENPMSVFND